MSDANNPFVHKMSLSNLQIAKMCVLGVVLLPIRLLVAFVCIVSAGSLAMIALAGLDQTEVDRAPFTGWRLLFRNIVCIILRFMFMCVGFVCRVKGEQASSKDAPILVVAPHSTFFDALAVAVMGAPSVVAKAETSNIPFWGDLIRFTQPVLVHRSDTNSRQTTIKQISQRAEGADSEGWQQVLIFPEGTCTNRTRLITFRLGSFYPGVTVQPVTVRYDNLLDTVTWTWEGITAVWVIVYSLSQLYMNCTIEFLPPYTPDKKEVEDPKLFASNVRAVMAESLGVGTTDCNYFDYLKIEKCKKMLKQIQKLQRRLDVPLLELTAKIDSGNKTSEGLLDKISEEEDDLKIVQELCGDTTDLRILRLVSLIATDKDALTSFLNNSCKLYDENLGEDRISTGSLEKILQSVAFLTPKEAKEMTDLIGEDQVVTKLDLEDYLAVKKPNLSKVVRCWEDGLAASLGDLLAMSASITKQVNKRMEAVAETGTNFLSAGKEVVSDVSASITSSKDKMTGALSSAVTSLHKRTGSRSETEKKTD